MVDAHGIMVKNAMLINSDYRMHASIQGVIVDMFKKAKIWAIREPQNMFHGLVPEILKEYYDQHLIKKFTIQTMRVDSRMNKYNPRNPNRGAVKKRLQRLKLTIRNQLRN